MDSLSRTAPSLFVCFVLVSLLVPSLGQGPDLTPSEQKLISELTRRMDYFQQKLTEAVNAAENLNIDCLGINQDICAAMEIQSNKADQMSLGSHWSPGKRSSSAGPQTNSVYKELQRKKAIIQHVNGILHSLHGVLNEEKKRSCQMNLGFPCDTQKYMDVGKMLAYLRKPGSPGKKR